MNYISRFTYLWIAIFIGLGSAPQLKATSSDETIIIGTAAAVGALVTGGLAYLGYCSYENNQANEARKMLDDMAQEILYRQRSTELMSPNTLINLFYNRIGDYKSTLSETRAAVRKIEKMIKMAQQYVRKYHDDSTYENRQIAQRASNLLPSLRTILTEAQEWERMLAHHEKLIELTVELENAAQYRELSRYTMNAHTARTLYPESQWALIDLYQELKTRKQMIEQVVHGCARESYFSDRAITIIHNGQDCVLSLNMLINAVVSLQEYQQQMHYKKAYEIEQERLRQERIRTEAALQEAEAARQQAENKRKELILQREKLEHQKETFAHEQRQELSQLRKELHDLKDHLANKMYFGDSSFMLEMKIREVERRIRELQVELYGIFGFWL